MLDELRSYLRDVPTGKVPLDRSREIEIILSRCWDELRGSGLEKMEGYKLLNRTEDMQWAPPILTFDIERHAQQSGGSTRAAVYTWEVNTETSEASIVNERQRYIGGMDKPLKVEPLAEEVVKLIVNHANDPRLRWLSDMRVKIAMRKFIPKTNWRTTKGRTKRFQKCVVQLLGEHWKWCTEPWHRDEIEKTNSG